MQDGVAVVTAEVIAKASAQLPPHVRHPDRSVDCKR
jgi:hypothetical protein